MHCLRQVKNLSVITYCDRGKVCSRKKIFRFLGKKYSSYVDIHKLKF